MKYLPCLGEAMMKMYPAHCEQQVCRVASPRMDRSGRVATRPAWGSEYCPMGFLRACAMESFPLEPAAAKVPREEIVVIGVIIT